MNKKYLSLLIVIALIFSLPGMNNLSSLRVYADEKSADETDIDNTEQIEVISIKTAEEFVEFADNAKKQDYSSRKLFSLENDLDLTSYPNTTVPFMDGLFEGNSHSISGLILDEDMSDYALFRYVGENGQIKDLTVEANVKSGEKQKNVAIIVGNNSGTIINCTAKGELDGQSQSGAIAGLNDETGTITNCVNESEINGKYQTGGIAGINKGKIYYSINNGRINANSKLLKKTRESDGSSVNISISNAVTGLAADERANETGGIAGYNEGEVNECTNNGVIGCSHLGGATGGIVGHLNGNIRNCKNTASVYGHKQIGGIVGYFEASDAFVYDVDYVQQLRDQLDELSDAIDDVSTAGEALGDNFSSNADLLSAEVKNLRQSLEDYADGFDRDYDESRGRIRSQANNIKEIVDDMDYDFHTKSIQKAVHQLKEDTDKMIELIAKLRMLTADMTAEDYATLASLMEALRQFEQTSAEYQELYRKIIELLAGAGKKSGGKSKAADDSIDNPSYMDMPADNVADDGNSESDAGNTEGDNSGDSDTANTEGGNSGNSDTANTEGDNSGNDDAANTEGDNSGNSDAGSTEGDNSVNGDNGESAGDNSDGNIGNNDSAQVITIVRNFEEFAAQRVISASGNAMPEQNIAQIKQILDELAKYEADAKKQSDIIMKYMDKMPGEFEDVEDDVKEVRDHFDVVYDVTNDFLNKIDNRADIMRSDVRNQGDIISNTLDYTHDQLDSDWDRFNKSLDRLTDTTHDLRVTVSDGYDEIRDRIKDRNIYVDVSELADIKNGTGRIISCSNSGEINADSLAGGLVGIIDKADTSDISLGIISELFGSSDKDDIEFEDEDEEKKDSVTKHIEAVIYDCKNTADVLSKGDFAGGAVGKSNYGYIKDCQNYGDVIAEDGQYIGGIAGFSKLTIDGAYVLGGLNGKSLVGGVAGKGNNISNSVTCAYMDMDEEYSKSAGAIAGKISGEAFDNKFVDNGFGAIDGVTKTTEAEGMKYKELLNSYSMPLEFKQFNIRFIDEDKVVWENTFKFGENLLESEYPELIANEGEYAYWQEKDLTPICRNASVHAIRRVFVPSVQAKLEDSESAKPDVLLGGKFYPDTVLAVSNVTAEELNRINEEKKKLQPDIKYVIAKNISYEITQEEPFNNDVSLRVLKDSLIPVNTLLILDENFKPVTDVIAVDSVESFLAIELAIPQKGYIISIEKVSNSAVIFGTIAVLILLAILVLLIIFLRRKRKALKKRIKQALEDTEKPIEELQARMQAESVDETEITEQNQTGEEVDE